VVRERPPGGARPEKPNGGAMVLFYFFFYFFTNYFKKKSLCVNHEIQETFKLKTYVLLIIIIKKK